MDVTASCAVDSSDLGLNSDLWHLSLRACLFLPLYFSSLTMQILCNFVCEYEVLPRVNDLSTVIYLSQKS